MLLRQNAQTYYDLAMKKLDEGDFPLGIYHLYCALWRQPDPDIKLELAEAYFDIDNLELAEKFYVQVLAERPKDEDAYLGLINCMLQQNEYDLAEYYYHTAVNLGILDENEMVMDDPPARSDIKIYDRTDKSELMNIAAKLMMSGDIEYAKQLLRSVRPEAKQYREANSLLAIIAFNEGDYDGTLAYAEKILSVEANDPYGLICKVMALHHLGFTTEFKENLSLLDAVGELDDKDTMRAAMCMMNIGLTDRAIKYLRRATDFNGYDRSVLTALAVCLGASENYEEAKKTVITAHRLYPEDAEIKLYARLISNGESEKLRQYMLHGFSGKEWCRDVAAFLDKYSDAAAAERVLKHDGGMLDKINWLFTGDERALQVRAGKLLAADRSRHDLVRSLLLAPSLNLQVKKELFKAFLCHSADRVVKIYICGLLRAFTPRRFRRYEPLNDSYYSAYATFAFIDTDFDKRLFEAYGEIKRRLERSGASLNVETGAALMFAIAEKSKDKKYDRAGVCEVFKIPEEEFGRAAAALNLNEIYEF